MPMTPALREEFKAFRVKLGGAFGGSCSLLSPTLQRPSGVTCSITGYAQPRRRPSYQSSMADYGTHIAAHGQLLGSTCRQWT